MTIHSNFSCSAGCVFFKSWTHEDHHGSAWSTFSLAFKGRIDRNHRRIHRSLELPRRNTNPGTAGYNTVSPSWLNEAFLLWEILQCNLFHMFVFGGNDIRRFFETPRQLQPAFGDEIGWETHSIKRCSYLKCDLSYCWWKKSCTSWYDKYPIICRVSYIPGGAGFLPSTVSCLIFSWRRLDS